MIDERRVRRYVERTDGATVPQVLGRFELPPSAAEEVRKVVKSPDGGTFTEGKPGEDLYRHTSPPTGGGWGGYLPYPSPVGGLVSHKKRSVPGGVER